ncbi:MAG: hypothetical protein K5643_08960 [Saccharofermentans sp.]|nr:hypothetical protein [Saccharofermentans sp.]
MGGGYHGGFGRTHGAIAGDANFPSYPTKYFENIARRTDIDKNGIYDIVAHGSQIDIQVTHNGQIIKVDSRIAARLISLSPGYKRGQSIRLLSCNTGMSTKGFAQNLANKLNVIVYAPTKVVWAYPDGRYIVAGRKKNNPNIPDLNNRGSFKVFYPGGRKNEQNNM